MAKLKVEGKASLVRDEYSKAIINTNSAEYEQAKRLKEQINKRNATIQSQGDKIDNLTQKVDILAEIVKKLTKEEA